jgi:hypothetical protein
MSKDPTECIGTLLVHSSDVKELSGIGMTKNHDEVECVGSLLVHSSDVKELSEKASESFFVPTVNLRQRVTAGTLLVKPDDLRSPDRNASDNAEGGDSIQKRLTNTLSGPPPADSEVDSWAD